MKIKKIRFLLIAEMPKGIKCDPATGSFEYIAGPNRHPPNTRCTHFKVERLYYGLKLKFYILSQ